MPNGLTGEHVPGNMDSALRYIGVSRDSVGELSASLRQLIKLSERVHTSAESFIGPASELQLHELPKFFAKHLESISIHATGVLRIENVQEKDLALLRHAADFVEDIARCAASGQTVCSPGAPLELFPVCETENDQAFWQSHQDQVIACFVRSLGY